MQRKYKEIIELGADILLPDNESLELIHAYERHKILPVKFRNDMLHIAVATVSLADILVSWNFRHIVRFDKIRQFNAVNTENGYQTLAIHSPREVTYYEEV